MTKSKAKNKKTVKPKTPKSPANPPTEVETPVAVELVDTAERILKAEKETEAAKESLLSKLTETSAVSEKLETPVIEKGNVIEQSMSSSELPGNTVGQTTEATEDTGLTKEGQPRKNKPGAGRPPKAKTPGAPSTSAPAAPDKSIDIIASSVEGMVFPIVAKKYHKKYDDLKFSKDQKEMLLAVMPPSDWMRPSWPMYITSLIALSMQNFFAAADDEQTRKIKEEVARQTKIQFEEMKQNIKNPGNSNTANPRHNTDGAK